MVMTHRQLTRYSKNMPAIKPTRTQSPDTKRKLRRVLARLLSRWRRWYVKFVLFLDRTDRRIQSHSYFMSGNIAVVGAVINLGSADAAQTFAPTLGHQAALAKGFGYNEQAGLLKAKALLM